ncbi:cell death regulator Aven [Biomphalaria pfeifferi]|uniref:Cell death regulator Aven n=1 Tax=Biomphalaria pfeifferi TaxID=112525 RepID=A0AAD8BPR0_BIOPF|nr:cell death regulator Aven [Biomphalaria pfeifferi]
MRPDEHKRKKNEAYKRKHGITGASKSNVDKSLNNKESDDKKKGKHKHKTVNEKTDTNTQQTQIAIKKIETASQEISIKSYSLSGSSDSEENENAEVTKSKKTYRRRQIESNWQKYELDPSAEEERVTSRGENFDKLMSMTGKALSHFRFKDELEWEHDVVADDLRSSHQILNIDSSKLSQYLSCIPVHKVLGISSDIFTPSQVEEMIEEAKRNAVGVLSHDTHETKSLQDEINRTNHAPATKFPKIDHPVSNLSPLESTTLLKTVPKPHVGRPTTENQVTHEPSLNSTCIEVVGKKAAVDRLSLEDEDLDLLLGDSRANTTTLEEQNMLNTSLSSKLSNIVDTTHLTPAPLRVSSKVEDSLEDWLDSVLDD